MLLLLRLLWFSVLGVYVKGNQQSPNIVIILADDLGWSDVGFHGSDDLKTPNIDALAYHGLVFSRHYTQPSCTPSRTALLSGRYPFTIGMQGYPLRAGEPRGLPLSVELLPEHFKRLGYATHALGKWHIGSHMSVYTPTHRGFDSHFGYWYGYIGYHDHSIAQEVPNHHTLHGLDMHHGVLGAWETKGRYATELFTRRAVSIIEEQNVSQPLLLYLAHLAPHGPLEVPDVVEAEKRFPHITDIERRLYAEMVWQLDMSVGEVVSALHRRGILNNTIILFCSDNGGQPYGLHYNKGSNWPLRGTKFTLFEGGVRTIATLWHPRMNQGGRVSDNFIHITDWLPTLYTAAGGNISDLGLVDGKDHWAWMEATGAVGVPAHPPPRSEVLLNIDEAIGLEAIIEGNWKLTKGTFHNGLYDGHTRPELTRHTGVDTIAEALTSSTAQALKVSGRCGEVTKEQAAATRTEATITCTNSSDILSTNLTGTPLCVAKYCLFNIFDDPCELQDVANVNTQVVISLIMKLNDYRRNLVPQLNRPVDVSADPAQFNNTWCPWLDYVPENRPFV